MVKAKAMKVNGVRKKGKRPKWWKKTTEDSRNASTDTKGNHLCCICACVLVPGFIHREHHQPWALSRDKFGYSSVVFNTAGPVGDACDFCNPRRSHETPTWKCVLRNSAFLDRMKNRCPGIGKSWIARKLSRYPPYRDIEMGPETSYAAVEDWLASEFKNMTKKKKGLF